MAVVRATTEAIGLTQLAASWGISLSASVHVDSSAALAVVSRQGNGRLRHVRIGHLWIQEVASSEEVRFAKVRGYSNPADCLTKHLPAVHMAELLAALSQFPRTGGAAERLLIKSAFGSAEPQPRGGPEIGPSHARTDRLLHISLQCSDGARTRSHCMADFVTCQRLHP